MALFDLSLIEATIIEPMVGRRVSKPTKAKWRRLASIPEYTRYADGEVAARLVAVACLRLECPIKPITPIDAMRFVVQNREKLVQAIQGCQAPVALNIDDPIDIDGCIAILAEHSRRKVSKSTLRRWCGELGIPFYSGSRFYPVDVERILEHCKRKQQERVDRGRQLGVSRRDQFVYCEAV